MSDAGQPRRKRVVMAVNNPATIDNRVVKSAEAMASAGYECHVVGLLRSGFESEEYRNGVQYHRVPLIKGPVCILAGLGLASKVPAEKQEKTDTSTLKAMFSWLARVPYFLAIIKAVFYLFLFVPVLLLSTIRESIRKGPHTKGWTERVVRTSEKLSERTWRGVRDFVPRVVPLIWGVLGGIVFLALLVALLPLAAVYEWICHRLSEKNWQNRVTDKAFHWTRWIIPLELLHSQKRRNDLGDRLRKVAWLHVANMRGRYARAMVPKLRELQGDIYHAHELWPLEACALAARACGARLVYDSHELEAHRNAPYSRLERWLWTQHERRQVRRCDHVMAVSNGCARELERAYGLEEVTVLRNVPWTRQQTPPVGLRETLCLGPDMPLIVYVGSVTFNRGLQRTLEALHELPGFSLVTVGPWRKDTREELLIQAQKGGLSGRFFMHPKVPPEVLPKLIADADVSVIPIQNVCLSYWHCLPNKLFESAVAGLPMVVSDFPDMREFVEGNDIGAVCDPSDPRSIAEAIRKVYYNRHRYYSPEKIARLCRENCFETESRKLQRVYEQLIPSQAQSQWTVVPLEAHVSKA